MTITVKGELTKELSLTIFSFLERARENPEMPLNSIMQQLNVWIKRRIWSWENALVFNVSFENGTVFRFYFFLPIDKKNFLFTKHFLCQFWNDFLTYKHTTTHSRLYFLNTQKKKRITTHLRSNFFFTHLFKEKSLQKKISDYRTINSVSFLHS